MQTTGSIASSYAQYEVSEIFEFLSKKLSKHTLFLTSKQCIGDTQLSYSWVINSADLFSTLNESFWHTLKGKT